MSKIRVENVSKVFNPHSRNKNQVLKNVSFELPEKGLIAIFGKSGSVKTTLLNIIGGLDKQDSGKIYIDDECTSGKVDKIRNAKIGFIFQNYYLEKGYTISEIMHNQMTIAGFKDEEEIKRRTEAVLKLVEMDRFKNKQGDALSGGQKQRVAIARALIKGSDVILADEPTGNLDAENTTKVMDILKEISKTQLVVIVTHELSLIEKYADNHIKLVDMMLIQGYDEPNGKCKVTKGYNLPSKFIFHTVGPIYKGSIQDDIDLKNCYLSCLKKADEMKLESICFCSLSTGLYGFPIEKASLIAISTVKKYLKEENKNIKKIIFDVFSEGDFDAYNRKIKEINK